MEKFNRIIIDLDNTAWATTETICELYNDDYSAFPFFKPVKWYEMNTWDWQELQCAKNEEIKLYFNQPRFFRTVKPMGDFNKVVNLLKEKLPIVFCSCGYGPNLKLKEEKIAKDYPFAEFIGVDLSKYEDKSHVDMSGAIFIDDLRKNLETSNASMKILFGDEETWNQDVTWDGFRCYNWWDVYRLLSPYMDMGCL